ncbi:BCCT family transporter [Anaerobacillus sp. MEB173]|uniref:BCCT family transporter n=1 Tax=Anaerobacillus sp. MEB173 TaxID=3383345 RepID=UPI003F91ACB3
MKEQLNVKPKIGSVFIISTILVGLFVLWGVINPDSLGTMAGKALDFTISRFGWFYMIGGAFFVGLIIFLGISRFGKIKLGKDDEAPKYSYLSWIAMLFSAGIGAGFVFWGVAEPILYFKDPPVGITAETSEAAQAGLLYSVYHWAFHPWAFFALAGLALAIAQYRLNQPALVSSAFYPILGDRIKGWSGKSIDTLAVISTATGVATTFGLSAMQITGGLSHLTSIPNTTMTQLTIIGIVTVLFLFSAASGLDRGIKILSNVNMALAGLLLLSIMMVGPTLFILENIVTSIGGYVSSVLPMSLTMTPFSDSAWLGSYTIFFWAWHMSWAPFMGIFIARISRGRTIREFVGGVLLVPAVLAAIWFTAFGGTALYLESILGIDISTTVFGNVELALFTVLNQLPLSGVTSLIAITLIMVFFITSADSASYVLGSMTTNGSINPPMSVRLIWGLLIAATASVLLLSGGLKALQTASIVAALPFTMIMVGIAYSLVKTLSKESAKDQESQQQLLKEQLKEELREEMIKANENLDQDQRKNIS